MYTTNYWIVKLVTFTQKTNMKKIVHIISSASGEGSYSIRLGKALINKINEQYPNSETVERDLVADDEPHLTMTQVGAMRTPPDQLTPEATALLTYSDQVIAELMEADIVVIGVPMINFSIPSQLKTWVDNIARAGKTFKYGEFGPEGLVNGKKVYLVIASGGIYSEGPMQAYDFIEPYLRALLGFVGMTDVTVLRAEGTAIPTLQEKVLEDAIAGINITNEEESLA